ncbi:MAG: HAD family hydrolase [Candidatus Xenobiia bacterium LiM19]
MKFQARGMRVIGFACREVPAEDVKEDLQEMTQELTWLGFTAIADPVRPEVPDAIKMCQDAGILVKIITGDNKETATEIARQINLWDAATPAGAIMTGKEFSKLSNEEGTGKGRGPQDTGPGPPSRQAPFCRSSAEEKTTLSR